jgi:hypothetical protein
LGVVVNFLSLSPSLAPLLPDASMPYHFQPSKATIHNYSPQSISKKFSFEWYFWDAAGPKSMLSSYVIERDC